MKRRIEILHTKDWYIDDVMHYNFGFKISQDPGSWYQELLDYRKALEVVEGTYFNQLHFYRETIDHSLDLKEGVVKKIKTQRIVTKINTSKFCHKYLNDFEARKERLEQHSAADFASEEFLLRYDRLSYENNKESLENYPLVWSLPLKSGSWTKLVKSMTSAIAPVRIPDNKHLQMSWKRRVSITVDSVR